MLRNNHLSYLKDRGVQPEQLSRHYFSQGEDLCILYCDPNGMPYKDYRGENYIVKRLFPTGKPKFKAPTASGSRPYFSPLIPKGYLNNTNIPLVFIEGPIKVDSCYQHIPAGFCFVGLTGTWNTKDRRDTSGIWNESNGTRLLPELKEIPLRGRQVIILFDSDIEDNISVDKAASDIANWTRQHGAQPYRCQIPSEPDGSKNGADDFLVRHGAQLLIDHLESAEIEGWPIPASLLTASGDLKPSYTPAETKRLVKSLARISDIATVDLTCRVLSTKLRIPFSQLLADIDDCRAGTTGDGFLATEADLDGDDEIDSSWVIPYLLPKGETIIISGDPGVSKSLLCYSIAHAVATGSEFLGFPIAKGIPLILQLEEGGTASRRLKAIGLKGSECFSGLPLNEAWYFSKTFDLAKPRQVERLKLLIRNKIDLVIIDSARAVARSMNVDENHADFGKLVIRKIAKIISDCGKSGIITHHNAKGSGKAAGSSDILAAVWGGFNLKSVERDEELRVLQTDKKREISILWELRIQRTELIEGLPNGWSWKLESDKSHMAPDQSWRSKFQNVLMQQEKPIGLGEIAQIMGLSANEEKTLRSTVDRDTACRRWLVNGSRRGVKSLFFIPHEFRNPTLHQVPCKDGVEATKTHPPRKEERMLELLQERNPGVMTNPNTTLRSTLQTGSSQTPDLQHNHLNLSGVSVSSPRLIGVEDIFWQIVNDNPNDLPVQIANKLQAATGRSLNGAEVKVILMQGSNKNNAR